MRQPDNLPAFCRVHRNGRPLIGQIRATRRAERLICAPQLVITEELSAVQNGGSSRVWDLLACRG